MNNALRNYSALAMPGSSNSIMGRRAGYSRATDIPPTNDTGEPAPHNPGRTDTQPTLSSMEAWTLRV
jgi:hypothetical protein